ncbi:hypothetical protein KA344_02285 [bacterium]|nr:hypothetical protein [bacterium]
MRYVPYHRLANLPNIIVDGKANDSTVLTLSHWPSSNTPVELKADLSAEIVYRYLNNSDSILSKPCDVVSNNHFDEDGLVSLYSLLNPQAALEEQSTLVDIASAGDFGTFKDRESARVCFVLSAWSNPDLSPLNQGVFARPYPEVTAVLYEELLVRLPNIIQKIDNLRRYWQEEDDFLDTTENAIASGLITLEEFPEVDLLVVRVQDNSFPYITREHCPSWISSVVHPMALHNRTERMRLLVMQGRHYEFYYRYETWVDFVSRPLAKRLDLSNLAKILTTMENGRGCWQFTGNDEIIARLKLVDGKESRIDPEDFLSEVKGALAQGENLNGSIC